MQQPVYVLNAGRFVDQVVVAMTLLADDTITPAIVKDITVVMALAEGVAVHGALGGGEECRR